MTLLEPGVDLGGLDLDGVSQDTVALFLRQPPHVQADIARSAATEGQRQVLLRIARVQAGLSWRDTPASMMVRLTNGEYRDWEYVKFLSDKFVDAVTGVSPRQIWNLPSRYGKTNIAKWGCVWCLDRTHGRAKLLIVSYGAELAKETAADVRDLLLVHEDVLRGQLREDRRRADRWVTDAGGGLASAGIDGRIIGFGAGDGLQRDDGTWLRGGVLLDDPHKNWMEAHSEARRQHVFTQFKGVVRGRLDQEAAWIIIIHHRMHENDLTGMLKAEQDQGLGDHWEIVSLPALAYDDVPDPLGRAPGEPLEPERFSLEDVLARAEGYGSYLAAALEQQRPTSPKGNELQREWFVLAESAELPRKPEQAISSWDTKAKNREGGDFVVGQTWWKVGKARWCMDQMRGQYDHATTANAIALTQVRHPEISMHVVEAAASADEVLPMLKIPQDGYEVTDEMAVRLGMNDVERHEVQQIRRAGMANLKPEPVPPAKKPDRARAWITPVAEQRNCRLPADAPWVGAWLDEMAAFPRGVHDDQVDAASQALKYLRDPITGAGAAFASGTVTR